MEEPRAQHINHCQNTKLTTPTQHSTPHHTPPHLIQLCHGTFEGNFRHWAELNAPRAELPCKKERGRETKREAEICEWSQDSQWLVVNPRGCSCGRRKERGSAASFGGTIKCLVNKLRLPFDNMHAASWAQQQKRQGAKTEREKESRKSRERREGAKL